MSSLFFFKKNIVITKNNKFKSLKISTFFLYYMIKYIRKFKTMFFLKGGRLSG